ncbi:MAG TPA: class I SAM-dependent methyltransferase [Kofleriaceae bacterium]
MARRGQRDGGRKPRAAGGERVRVRVRGSAPGRRPGRPVDPAVPPSRRGLGGLVDPAWRAISYPPGGFTARDFAAFVDSLIDAGSHEHYADAALYDYEYRRRRADVSFYRELARRRGADRILELGAGSGRVTVPLARDGRHVVAIDRSPAMLARLEDRIGRLPTAAAARITPVAGDLRSFSVRGRFPLAIAAFNVLEHLYTRGEMTACLQRVAAHLEPGGAFAFDVQLPDLAWLARDSSRRWAKTRFTDPTTGRSMYYSTNHDYDPVSQIALIRLYYDPADEPDDAGADDTSADDDERDADEPGDPRVTPVGARNPSRPPGGPGGPPGATRVVQLSQRKFFPAELEALVAHAGFRVTERYGDFSFRPLDGTAESQVLVCEPTPGRGRSRAVSR